MNIILIGQFTLIGQLSLHGLAWIIILSLAHQIPSSSAYYCEGLIDYNDTIFVHPYNTWSNISFFIIAWVESILLFYLATINREFIYTIIAPFNLLHLALASFLYHSILYTWTGYWDVIAIFIYLGFETGTSLTRVLYLWKWRSYALEAWRFSTWVVLSTLSSVIACAIPGFDSTTGTVVGISLCVGLTLIFESIVLVVLRNETTIFGYLLYIGILCFGIPAICMWYFGANPHPVSCYLHIHYIGHGTWHVLISIAIFLLFLTRLVVVPKSTSKVRGNQDRLGKT